VRKAALAIVVLALLAGWVPPAGAQPRDLIEQILVRDNYRIEADAILAMVESREGEYLSGEDLDRDLRAVYRMGYFDDVAVEIEQGQRGVIVIFVVKEKSSVKEFRLAGNDKLDDDKIWEVVTLKANTILDTAAIKDNIQKIKRLYSDEGYFMADVDYEIEEAKNNQVIVTLRITEYRKVLIKRINFVGNEAFTDDELRKIMKTKEGNLWSWITSSGVFKEGQFEADLSILNTYYRNNGYADIKVDKPVITLTPDKRWMFITVGIEEGVQYMVGTVRVTGELLFSEEHLLEKTVLKEGDVFDYSAFIKDLEEIKATYTDIGFAFANVNPRTPKDTERRIVDIDYRVDKGNLAYLEQINIKGNDRTRDKVIRRELVINEGDLYSGPGIRKSKERLMRLGYFEDVNITTERGSAEETVNLNIEVAERMTGNFIVGVGFSSLENFIGTAQISHSNLFGMGHKISLSAELGKYRRNINLNYVYPYFMDTKLIAGLILVNAERDYLSFTKLDKTARLRMGYPLGWDIDGFASFGYEDVEITDIADESSVFLSLQKGRTVTTSWIFSLERDTINNPYDPSRGSDNRISVEWASPDFGGDTEFIKYLTSSKWYFNVWWKLVLMFNGEIGYAQSLDGERLPISERFFLGGINSVRGFFSRSLGPEETNVIASNPDDPASGLTEVTSIIGGNKYLQGNIELITPIVPSVGLKGVLFFDIGNAFDDDEDFAYGKLRQSWGFGVRWISPIGPLRFEWGFPLYPQEGEDTQVFEFGMGTFF